MYDILDALVNIDYNRRSVDKLYAAARELYDKPICEAIADEILKVPAGRFVFLTTGSVTRTWVDPRIGETDGPLGTAVLAKKIRELTKAVPLIISEASLIPPIGAVTQAAGLSVVTPEQAHIAENNKQKGQTSVACMLPFTTEKTAAADEAKKLLDEYNPALIISIEKAGVNAAGIFHNMRGHDYSAGRARVDHLILEGKTRGIPTIGIGDGGNEIGMGAIKEAVHKYVKYGAQCQCGCGLGMAAETATDILFTGSVSNWACYVVCAALALKTGKDSMLHDPETEKRLLAVAVQNGMVDGNTGKSEMTVDGFSTETNCAFISFMKNLVEKKILS